MKIYENWNTDFHLDWQKAAYLIMTILFNQMRNNINRTWEVEIQKYFLELRRWRSYWNRMCLYLRRGRFKVRGGDAGNTVAVWILAVYNNHRLKTLLLISKLLFLFILISPLTQKDSWLLCMDLWADTRTCEFLVELRVNHYTLTQPEPCLEQPASKEKNNIKIQTFNERMAN